MVCFAEFPFTAAGQEFKDICLLFYFAVSIFMRRVFCVIIRHISELGVRKIRISVLPIGPGWREYVTSEFGWRPDPLTGEPSFHRGLDVSVYEGYPIYAALDGVVTSVGTSPHSSYGYHVTIDHGGGFVTLYAHNARVLVAPGDEVKAGQQVAEMGATGRVTGVHLHFEVMVEGEVQNPMQYIP